MVRDDYGVGHVEAVLLGHLRARVLALLPVGPHAVVDLLLGVIRLHHQSGVVELGTPVSNQLGVLAAVRLQDVHLATEPARLPRRVFGGVGVLQLRVILSHLEVSLACGLLH